MSDSMRVIDPTSSGRCPAITGMSWDGRTTIERPTGGRPMRIKVLPGCTLIVVDDQGKNHELMPGTYDLDEEGKVTFDDLPFKADLKEAIDQGFVVEVDDDQR